MKEPVFAAVVFPDLPGKSFTYTFDRETVQPGARVVVPFKNTYRTGYVVKAEEAPPKGVKRVRPVDRVILPVIPAGLFELALWMAEYYREDLGRTLHSFYPPSARLKVKDLYSKTGLFDADDNPSAGAPLPGKFDRREFINITGTDGAFLEELVAKGYVERKKTVSDGKRMRRYAVVTGIPHDDVLSPRAYAQRGAFSRLSAMGGEAPAEEFDGRILRELVKKGLVYIDLRESEMIMPDKGMNTSTGTLNVEQRQVFEEIIPHIESGFSVHLLHGVTGSGKTEIYLKLIEAVVRQGRDAIYLVPEVALTTHLMSRIKDVFGDRAVLTHGYMKAGERYDSWRAAFNGGGTVMVGPRSAVFSPLPRLGLIIVDEEHEGSYKQDDAPRYNGRDTAIYRAKIEDVPVVLGSATPSVESYYNAVNGRYTLHNLSSRFNKAELPAVRIIDISTDVFNGGRTYPFSESMLAELGKRMERREQSIIFINRKGYDTHMICNSCGEPAECAHCSKLLTYYKGESLLKCNLCGASAPLSEYTCGKCGKTEFAMRGMGTEKIAERLTELLPGVRLIRMDGSVTRNYDTVKDIFDRFGKGEGDILIGTQMIAKGIDFENVTFVGIVNADSMMNIPDFRANERTYQLISQVSGRAGRGAKPGLAFIQTYSPGHYTITNAIRHDYRGFYDSELTYRKEMGYPPFSYLVRVILENRDKKALTDEIHILKKAVLEFLPEKDMVLFADIRDIYKRTDRYRYSFIIRTGKRGAGKGILMRIEHAAGALTSSVYTDVDPQAFGV